MFQKLYKWKQIQRITMVCLLGSFSVSCAFLPPLEGESGQSSIGRQGSNIDGVDSFAGATGGLAIGAVVSANGRDALKPYQRWRYADQLASYILHANPQLHGQVDSYEYVSKRMGKPFANLLKSYRLTGDLDGESLDALRSAELRRRYLMMVNILPFEEINELSPDSNGVVGKYNEEVDDYYDVQYQTIRVLALRVQVYDTAAGSKIYDDIFRSDHGGVSLATERTSRKYVGNSLVATLSNSFSNGFRDNEYPPAPKTDDVFQFLWGRIAEEVPGAF